MSAREDEWLWGWDPTPGIVSVWAEPDGRAIVWRRLPETRELVCERERFRPWVLLASLDDVRHLGASLQRETPGAVPAGVSYRELAGPGALRFLVSADSMPVLARAVLHGAARRLGQAPQSLRDLGEDEVLALPPEEQYLVSSGRNYFRELGFDQLARMQFDLETEGLDPERHRVFMIAVRDPRGQSEVLEAQSDGDAGERELLSHFARKVRELDPDVIENHNLHGFDLPFLARRAQLLDLQLNLGRLGQGFFRRPSARGAGQRGEPAPGAGPSMRRMRYTVPGRELIDSMDAVLRYDFAARDLPGHGLKAVARHFGIASSEREYIPGGQVREVYTRDPERVRRYAADDVHEAAGLAHLLGGAAFALARMAPRRYERLADAGPATGVIDPLLVRAYLREGAALPAHEAGDGTQHSGAALYLFATGVAQRIVKADVASLYPSLMRQYRIGPARDRLGVLVALVDRLVEQRLHAKALARAAQAGSTERHLQEAISAAMKIVVNSAYGYLGAVGLTRFADVHAANEVTRHGRELLDLICRELATRGVTLLEADTDGVYFAVPAHWQEPDERRAVAEVAALLPERVQLEFDGRYAAMLSHEPKNYALRSYAGALLLRGVAFRSSRSEPFGEAFLRRAIGGLLARDVRAVRAAYLETVESLRTRRLPTAEVAARVRLTKTPAEYLTTRGQRRELPYEAMLNAGRDAWTARERIRVYRAQGNRAALFSESTPDPDDEALAKSRDPRDYDVDFYLRQLRETFATRLTRAFKPEDFAVLFADPQQLNLFPPDLDTIEPILTSLPHRLDATTDTEQTSEPDAAQRDPFE